MMVVAVVQDDEDDEPVKTSTTTNLSPVTKPAATRLLDHFKNVNRRLKLNTLCVCICCQCVRL